VSDFLCDFLCLLKAALIKPDLLLLLEKAACDTPLALEEEDDDVVVVVVVEDLLDLVWCCVDDLAADDRLFLA
jgi:hypothetical protein